MKKCQKKTFVCTNDNYLRFHPLLRVSLYFTYTNQIGIASNTKLSAIKLSIGASINGVVHKNNATIQNRMGVDNQTR